MKKHRSISLALTAVLTILLIVSCGDSGKKDPNAKPEYVDTITVLCENTMKDMMQPAFDGFQDLYPAYILNINYGTSLDCAKAALNNKTNAVIMSRDFTHQESQLAEMYNVKMVENPIAKDGFVFFTQKGFPFDSIHASQIKSWLTDKSYSLKNLFPQLDFEPLFVSTKAESGIFTNLSLLCADSMPIKRPVKPFDTVEEIKEYVRNNPNAIGIGYLSHLTGEEDLQAIRIGYHHADGRREMPQHVHMSWIIRSRYPYVVKYDIVTREGLTGRNKTMKFLNYVFLDKKIQQKFFDMGIIPQHAKFELIQEEEK
jgi:ABC-type phosphate transport system substrate-binding protein